MPRSTQDATSALATALAEPCSSPAFQARFTSSTSARWVSGSLVSQVARCLDVATERTASISETPAEREEDLRDVPARLADVALARRRETGVEELVDDGFKLLPAAMCEPRVDKDLV